MATLSSLFTLTVAAVTAAAAAASPSPPRIMSMAVTPRLTAPLTLLILFQSPFASTQEPQPVVEQFICEIPTTGCKNGMFNTFTCQCDCIPPYCRYKYDGTCTSLSSDDPMCGSNPWADCTRGVNCPWWINPMKDESCTTGPEIPAEMWEVYNTKKACCSNFPYSTICNRKIGTDSPTKYPTISTPDEGFEVIPIKFDLRGVPDDVPMRALKDEMGAVLRRLMAKLAERIPDLRITDIEEKVILDDRNSRKLLRNHPLRRLNKPQQHRKQEGKHEQRQGHRGLVRDVTLYWNAIAIRTEGVKFGPIIIQELRENYDEIVEQIQAFADTSFFGAIFSLNLCTSVNGRFSDCVFQTLPPTLAPTTAKPMTPTLIYVYDEEPDGGISLPVWSILLIVVGSLLFVGGLIGFLICMGWCACCWCAFCCCPSPCDRSGEKDEIHNNIYMDGSGGKNQDGNFDDSYSEKKSRTSRRSKKSTIRANQQRYYEYDEDMLELPPPEEEYSNHMLALPPPQQPQLQLYEGQSIDARTRATSVVPKNGRRSSVATSSKKKKSKKKSKRGKKSTRDPGSSKKPSRQDPSVYTVYSTQNSATIQNNGGRDPTMYVPGNELKPDPDSRSIFTESQSAAGYNNKYAKEPPLTPERDPSVYTTNGSESYYSHRSESSNNRSSRRMPRDPTMYMERRSSSGSGASAMYASHNSYRIADIDGSDSHYGRQRPQPPDHWREDEGQEDSSSFWTQPPT